MDPLNRKTQQDLVIYKPSDDDHIDLDQHDHELGVGVGSEAEKCMFLLSSAKFLAGEVLLVSSWLYLLATSCLVLAKKITLIISDDFSLTQYSNNAHDIINSSPKYSPIKSSTKKQSDNSFSSSYCSGINLDFNVSLLNLDEEDSELISERDEMEFYDQLRSGNFPSPSYNKISNINISSRNRTCEVSLSEIETEMGFWESDEPLFWPYERKLFDFNSQQTWDYFAMSPPRPQPLEKNKIKMLNMPITTTNDDVFDHNNPRKIRPQAHSHVLLRRLLILRPVAASHSRIMERRRSQRNDKASVCSGISTASSASSRFGATQNSAEVVPVATQNDITNVELRSPVEKSDYLDPNFFALKEKLPNIDILLGLDEFDGHEALDSEFNKDEFSFGDSLS